MLQLLSLPAVLPAAAADDDYDDDDAIMASKWTPRKVRHPIASAVAAQTLSAAVRLDKFASYLR
eukprot:6211055-Pleurochrysis_carterae.AAC.1